MSALGAFFIGDTVVFATDTICSLKDSPINIDGQNLQETIARFSSKSLYYPHLQTSVSCLGAEVLAHEYHDFIEKDLSTRAISSFDKLLEATESHFLDFIDRPEIEEFVDAQEINAPQSNDSKKGYLGVIFLIGLSHSDEEAITRGRPIIRAIKLVVYKDDIRKTVINHTYDKFSYIMHPVLPAETVDSIFDKYEEPNSHETIIDLIKAAKDAYDKSNRKAPLAGGDINFTVMNYDGMRLNTLHYNGYRFDDFGKIVTEIQKLCSKEKSKGELQDLLLTAKRLNEESKIRKLQAENTELKATCEELLDLTKEMTARISQLNGSNGNIQV